MSERMDPLYRRHFAYVRATARIKRRVAALLVHIDAHPEATRDTDGTLRRLDDLVGGADRLRKAL